MSDEKELESRVNNKVNEKYARVITGILKTQIASLAKGTIISAF